VNWFWINIPLMVIFFAAVSGIPLWLVFKHPDTGPAGAGTASTGPAEPAAQRAVRIPSDRRAATGRSRSAGTRAAGTA
jgi:hypothetical protein